MAPEDVTSGAAMDAIMAPDSGPAIIDFWGPSCGPCKAMAPHFDAVAEQFAEGPLRFYKVNTQAHPELGAAFGVRAVPTIVFVNNGDVLDATVGALDKARLSKKADWLLSKARGEGFLSRLFKRKESSAG